MDFEGGRGKAEWYGTVVKEGPTGLATKTIIVETAFQRRFEASTVC